MSTGATARSAVIPSWMPTVAALVLGGLLVCIGGLRLSGWDPAVAPDAVVLHRSLKFTDTPDGAVQVVDPETGSTVALMPGEQGFLRGVLRGLARDRRLQSLGTSPTYVLSLHKDGRLMLNDPETGRRIDLASFGHDNAAVFARWLPPARH